MKIKLIYALLGALFFVSQNSFAKEDINQSSTEEDQSLENNAGVVEKANLFANDYNYSPYLQVGGTRFFNVNSSKAADGADLFVPLWQLPSQMVFTHLRFFDRTGKPFEGNAHLGYRHLVPEKEHLYGIYVAFDRKRTEFGNYFNQLTLGVEGWFRSVFIGGNFYQPVGSISKFVGLAESAQPDRIQNNIWITANKQYEKALGGGDAEVGYELINGLVGYIGGYYFGAKDVDTICGPKARLTYDWSLENGKRIWGIFDKFGLEGGVQRDNPRGTTYYLSANIRVGLLPNKGSNLQGVARHMVDLVRRDIDIVSASSVETTREVVRDSNGEVLKFAELSDDQSQTINETDFGNALADANVKIVSIKGRIDNISPDTLQAVNGNKILVFGNTLNIVSPVTGKILSVDISSQNGVVGTITQRAANVLMGIKEQPNEALIPTNKNNNIPQVKREGSETSINIPQAKKDEVKINGNIPQLKRENIRADELLSGLTFALSSRNKNTLNVGTDQLGKTVNPDVGVINTGVLKNKVTKGNLPNSVGVVETNKIGKDKEKSPSTSWLNTAIKRTSLPVSGVGDSIANSGVFGAAGSTVKFAATRSTLPVEAVKPGTGANTGTNPQVNVAVNTEKQKGPGVFRSLWNIAGSGFERLSLPVSRASDSVVNSGVFGAAGSTVKFVATRSTLPVGAVKQGTGANTGTNPQANVAVNTEKQKGPGVFRSLWNIAGSGFERLSLPVSRAGDSVTNSDIFGATGSAIKFAATRTTLPASPIMNGLKSATDINTDKMVDVISDGWQPTPFSGIGAKNYIPSYSAATVKTIGALSNGWRPSPFSGISVGGESHMPSYDTVKSKAGDVYASVTSYLPALNSIRSGIGTIASRATLAQISADGMSADMGNNEPLYSTIKSKVSDVYAGITSYLPTINSIKSGIGTIASRATLVQISAGGMSADTGNNEPLYSTIKSKVSDAYASITSYLPALNSIRSGVGTIASRATLAQPVGGILSDVENYMSSHSDMKSKIVDIISDGWQPTPFSGIGAKNYIPSYSAATVKTIGALSNGWRPSPFSGISVGGESHMPSYDTVKSKAGDVYASVTSYLPTINSIKSGIGTIASRATLVQISAGGMSADTGNNEPLYSTIKSKVSDVYAGITSYLPTINSIKSGIGTIVNRASFPVARII